MQFLRGHDALMRLSVAPRRPTAWRSLWWTSPRGRRAELALKLADRRKDEFLATLAHELRNLADADSPRPPEPRAWQGVTDAQRRWSNEIINRQTQHMAMLPGRPAGPVADYAGHARGAQGFRRAAADG